MTSVLGCIVNDHNMVMVAVAALICVAGSFETVRLFVRAVGSAGAEKIAWLVLTAMMAGAQI